MKLTSTYQLLAQQYIGKTDYGNVYIRTYARVSSSGPDIENNKTKVYVEARIYTEGAYWFSSSGTTYSISFSGSNSSGTISCNGRYEVGETVLGSYSGYVTHNADGSREIHAECNFKSEPWGWDATASATEVELPTIARYANFTEHYVNAVTESTIQIKWNADANTDAVQYSLNGGSWVSTSGNPYTISGLSSGTTYSIKTKIRRTDSQLWTESEIVKGTTKDYVVKLNVNGTWKNAVPYVNVNGVWKKAIPYVNVNGVWKKGIN